jgi:hypothetical protein
LSKEKARRSGARQTTRNGDDGVESVPAHTERKKNKGPESKKKGSETQKVNKRKREKNEKSLQKKNTEEKQRRVG